MDYEVIHFNNIHEKIIQFYSSFIFRIVNLFLMDIYKKIHFILKNDLHIFLSFCVFILKILTESCHISNFNTYIIV